MWGRVPRLIAFLAFVLPLAAQEKPAAAEQEMDHTVHAMSHRHMDMGPHMKLTELRAARPRDRERAQEVVLAARQALERYQDYRVALADGYRIFLPNLPQKMYHFTNYMYAIEAAFRFNAEHPTSLLYEKTAGGYRLIGAMYTAPARVGDEELDSRIPLSVAQWHLHTNMCVAPRGREREYFARNPKFGLLGSIATEEECKAVGGRFKPQVFGWMVHVYPFEKTTAEIWSVERQMEGHKH